MCLKLKSTSVKHIAKTDIICYKFCYNLGSGFGNTLLKTYHRNFILKLGEIVTSDLIKMDRFFHIVIEEGLHSFSKYDDVLKFYSDRISLSNIAIVKCVIPQGSSYYKGRFCNYGSYASSALRYDEILLSNRVDVTND